MQALHGEQPDNVPASVWMHNFHAEIDHRIFADEAVRQAETFDWDYLKPQVCAEQFPQMWGLEFREGELPSSLPVFTRFPIKSAAEFGRLKPVSLDSGPLLGQLEALSDIRRQIGPDTPIVWTVFSPLVVARTMLAGGQQEMIEMLRSDPRPLATALEAIAVTLAEYAAEAVRRGADGIFLATTFASTMQITSKERLRYEVPLFREILSGIAQAPFNLLHLCGHRIAMTDYADCPISAFSWADGGDNPTLVEGHVLTGRAVLGGLPAKPEFGEMPFDTMVRQAEQACRDMDNRWLLLAPGCSVNPGSPDNILAKAAEAVARLRH
jgi:uroporphyrinogen decarboxylase